MIFDWLGLLELLNSRRLTSFTLVVVDFLGLRFGLALEDFGKGCIISELRGAVSSRSFGSVLVLLELTLGVVSSSMFSLDESLSSLNGEKNGLDFDLLGG